MCDGTRRQQFRHWMDLPLGSNKKDPLYFEPVKIMARKFARATTEEGICLLPQHHPGKLNDVAPILGFEGSKRGRTDLLTEHIHDEYSSEPIPQVFASQHFPDKSNPSSRSLAIHRRIIGAKQEASCAWCAWSREERHLRTWARLLDWIGIEDKRLSGCNRRETQLDDASSTTTEPLPRTTIEDLYRA